MRVSERLNLILAEVEKHGFMTVKELSDLCQVNVMTIRRDLKQLERQHKLRRTHGGAVSLNTPHQPPEPQPSSRAEGLLIDRIDVLIASAPTTKYESMLPESPLRKTVPVVAESTPLDIGQATVSLDNYAAGQALGRWAGAYARDHWGGRANVLDLTYHLTNTQQRSQGFLAGIREVLPDARLVLSLNSQSRYEMAYQLTRDALTMHRDINIIFGMNDTSAIGAVHACESLKIDPDAVLVLPFGAEGSSVRELLAQGTYCKAALGMFPEIVGPVCIEAAIDLWNQRHDRERYTTPHVVLTKDNLAEYYEYDGRNWKLCWDTIYARHELPATIHWNGYPPGTPLPKRIGFVYTFVEHEWYHSLIAAMQDYSRRLGIELEVVDVEQTLKDEIDWRRREIARGALAEIQPNETIALDSGVISACLADLLKDTDKPITVLSNSLHVLSALKDNPAITLISTGGVLRRSSMTLVGPTAEATLREIRVDKLFLTVNGVSLDFGLSHNNLSEVTMKQAMIRSAREVILLADHTCFGQESFIQVAPVTVVNKILSDDALPASLRLELNKLGIRVQLASA